MERMQCPAEEAVHGGGEPNSSSLLKGELVDAETDAGSEATAKGNDEEASSSDETQGDPPCSNPTLPRWHVVGGARSGGIIVRESEDASSEPLSERLSHGSIVQRIACAAGGARMQYRLLDGSGPQVGWVSTRVQGKPLLVEARELGVWRYGQQFGTIDIDETAEDEVEDSRAERLHEGCVQSFKAAPAKQACHAGTSRHRLADASADVAPLPTGGLTEAATESRSAPPVVQSKGVAALAWRRKDTDSLLQDFGFAVGGSMTSSSSTAGGGAAAAPSIYGRFDIRDEVCLRIGGFKSGDVVQARTGKEYVAVGVKPHKGRPVLWWQPRALLAQGRLATVVLGDSAAVLQRSLEPIPPLSVSLPRAVLDDFDAAEDSDEERVDLCPACHLPLGPLAYSTSTGKNGPGRGAAAVTLHAECTANALQQASGRDGAVLLRQQEQHKAKLKEKYGIGWQVDSMLPCNLEPALKLHEPVAVDGLCCLVLEGAGNAQTIRVARTLSPAASVNLELLSTALQVRRSSGAEAVFSLEPEAAGGRQKGLGERMQVKRFQPRWLETTKAGELLFQADYHLKELSMGASAQPVLGLQSALDRWASDKDSEQPEWNGRAWFVVKRANVGVAEDGALIPSVLMGVEAREQVVEADGTLSDSPITSPNHPLVRYAEDFSRHFELIAERKSVIFHLRELARASVLAKFLLEAEVGVPHRWFSAWTRLQKQGPAKVPQIWNRQVVSDLKVDGVGGEILNLESGKQTHGLYGGVELGLARFRLQQARQVSGALVASTLIALTRTTFPAHVPGKIPALSRFAPATPEFTGILGGVQAPAARAAARPRGGPAQPRPSMPPMLGRLPSTRQQLLGGPLSFSGMPEQPSGVDLNLNGVSVGAGKEMQGAEVRSATLPYEEDGTAVDATVFWAQLDEPRQASAPLLLGADLALLKRVYSPALSDRRGEGQHFIPPNNSSAHVERLHTSLTEEAELQKRRRQAFFAASTFQQAGGQTSPDNRGALQEPVHTAFPAAWRRRVPACKSLGLGKALPSYELPDLARTLPLATVIFDEAAEDGERFRIYLTSDGLEIRTTQEAGRAESVGAAFKCSHDMAGPRVNSRGVNVSLERHLPSSIATVTEFVERRLVENGTAALAHHYVELHLTDGSIAVTELTWDGSISWQVDPEQIRVRRSLAKVLRSQEVKSSGVKLQDVLAAGASDLSEKAVASASKARQFANNVYEKLVGAE